MRGLPALLLLASCAQQPAPQVMKCPTLPADKPPAATAPRQTASAARMVLAPGHWDWVDGSYAWIPPSWVPRPDQRAEKSGRIWQDGFWTSAGVACVWNPGRFLF